jgi:hypothetical protein
MSIGAGIFSLLQSKQPLTELVGSNVMPLVKAQALKTPCILYAIDGVDTNETFTGGSLADTYNVSFHVFDKDYDRCVTIGRVLRNVISHQCGKYGGWDFRMVRFQNVMDEFRQDGQLYGQSLMFTMRVKNDPQFGLPKILKATFTEVGALTAGGVNVYTLQALFNEQGTLSAVAGLTNLLAAEYTEEGTLSGAGVLQQILRLGADYTEAGTLTGRVAGEGFEVTYTEEGTLQGTALAALQLAVAYTEAGTLTGAAQAALALALDIEEAGSLTAAAKNIQALAVDYLEEGNLEGVGENEEGVQLLLDEYPNAAFAYSSLRLGNAINNALRASNAALNEQNITLGTNEINADELETFANGSLATVPAWIDQADNFGDFPQPTKALQPNITDANGNSLGFIDTTELYGASSKHLIKEATPRPATNGDYVVSLVFKNNTSTSTDSAVLCVKNSETDLFAFNIRRSGGNYIVHVIINANINPTVGFTIARNLSDWVLLTFTNIGGVLTCYADGVTQSTVVGESVDVRGANGVWAFLRRVAPTTNPRLLHTRTMIMYAGADLSGFNISGFNDKMKELHGIS